MKPKKHILFISLPLLGHSNQMLAIAQELVSRGHGVSFALPDVARDWVTKIGVQFISWNYEPSIPNVDENFAWRRISQTRNSNESDRLMLEQLALLYAPMYNSLVPILESTCPDLLVLDRGVIPAMDLAQQRNIPYIIQTQFLGNFVKTDARYPQFSTAYSKHMNIWERCLNRLEPLWQTIYFLPTLLKFNRVRRQCMLGQALRDPFVDRTTIVGNVFGIEIFRPLPEHVHLVGPIFSKEMPSPPDELRTWLDAAQAENGVIYVSFGTLATVEAWQANALLKGLTKTGLRILWSLPKAQQLVLPSSLPTSVRIEAFVPQFAVLAHAAVRLFLSHAGMNSILEALYWKTPILALPFFGDQHYNAARLVDAGVGLRISKQQFTSAEVHQKAEILLGDANHQKAIDRLASSFDAGGRDRAADIVEMKLI